MEKTVARRTLWTAAPALAALLCYAATLGAGFVYDDDVVIRTNPWVQDASVLLRLPGKPLLASPPMGTTNYYRPLVVVLYNLSWHSLGGRPLAFHLLNVGLHMWNATLVLLLVRRVSLASEAVAVGAATLFAVHPLTVEVVAWPSCLPELTYVALGLAALHAHIASWNRGVRFKTLAVLAFFLSCCCKETALSIVPLLVLLEVWLRPKRATILEAVRAVSPYIAAAAVFVLARTEVLHGLVARGAPATYTAADAVWSAPWLLLLYVKSMLIPQPLLVAHLIPVVTSPAHPKFLVGAAVAIGAIGAILRLRRARPDLAFAAAAAVIPVLPALYLPALGRDPFAERYAYLGLAGFCWLLVAGVDGLAHRLASPRPRWLSAAMVGALIAAASARSIIRCADWHDDGALGAATMRDEPRASIGYLLAGNWHVREGRKEEGLRVFEEGVARASQTADLKRNAIALSLTLGRLSAEDATAAYRSLAPEAGDSAAIQYNLGQALMQLHRFDEAKAALNRSLQLAPTSTATLTALAVVASEQGDTPTAISLCRQALAIDDRDTAALQQLGVALMRAGDLAGAVDALEKAVAVDPRNEESWSRLGVAYVRSGRLDDARRAWERALSIDPNLTTARQNLERLRQMAH